MITIIIIEMVIAATLNPFPEAPSSARLLPIIPNIKPSIGIRKDKTKPAIAIPLESEGVGR